MTLHIVLFSFHSIDLSVSAKYIFQMADISLRYKVPHYSNGSSLLRDRGRDYEEMLLWFLPVKIPMKRSEQVSAW